jgi:hypothetical protein
LLFNELKSGSFRDPAGFCFEFQGRMLRFVQPTFKGQILEFLTLDVVRKLMAAKAIIPTWSMNAGETSAIIGTLEKDHPAGKEPALLLEHQRIEFVSYPHEWPPEMLFAAGELTIDLGQKLVGTGFGLKDATPRNILFQGPIPVFVDLLSFEKRDPGDPLWTSYAQFIRNFILPLLVNKLWGIPLGEIFMSRRDGLTPAEVYPLAGPIRKWRPSFAGIVTIPVMLQRRKVNSNLYQRRLRYEPERAKFTFERLLTQTRKKLHRVQPKQDHASAWSAYYDVHSYSQTEFEQKQAFVRQVIESCRPKKVLDVGCNCGVFSLIAAKAGAQVVSIDNDEKSVGRLWTDAKTQGADILPLVVDFSRPSPGLGWRNLELRSFIDRATGQFDLVLMLAVVHHLMVTDGIPLSAVFEFCAQLNTGSLVFE